MSTQNNAKNDKIANFGKVQKCTHFSWINLEETAIQLTFSIVIFHKVLKKSAEREIIPCQQNSFIFYCVRISIALPYLLSHLSSFSADTADLSTILLRSMLCSRSASFTFFASELSLIFRTYSK